MLVLRRHALHHRSVDLARCDPRPRKCRGAGGAARQGLAAPAQIAGFIACCSTSASTSPCARGPCALTRPLVGAVAAPRMIVAGHAAADLLEAQDVWRGDEIGFGSGDLLDGLNHARARSRASRRSASTTRALAAAARTRSRTSAPSSSGRACRWCRASTAMPISRTSASTAAFAVQPCDSRAAQLPRPARQSGVRVHNSPVMSTRGEHLVRADRGFATGGGLVARLTAPASRRCSTRSTGGSSCGGIEATLPDGSKRRLGFHATGATAVVRLSSWLALVRLATSGSVGWYKAWTLGEWSSPDPVAIFELFSANAVRSATSAGPRDRSAGSMRSRTGCATMRRARRSAEHRRALRPRQ